MINIAIKVKKRYLGRDTREEHLVNERIRFPKVRVIDSDGSNIGEMSTRDAQKKADELELDLVCISPKAQVPVVKIVDYGKFMFEKKKRERENKKNQFITETKEVRLTPNIGPGDFDFKCKHARKFLEEGHRVKISLKFRGREMQKKEVGYDTMNRFIEKLNDVSTVDKAPVLNRIFLDAYLKSSVKQTKKDGGNDNGKQSEKQNKVSSDKEIQS